MSNKKNVFKKLSGLFFSAFMAIGLGTGILFSSSKDSVKEAKATDLEYSFTIQTSDFTTKSYADNNKEHTSTAICTTDETKKMDIKWTSYQVMQTSGVMQWQKNFGYIYNETDLGKINYVTVTSTAGTFTTYYGTTENPTSDTTVGGGYFTTKVGNATGKTSIVKVDFKLPSSLTISGTPTKTTYDVGESFDPTGLTVTGKYDDESTINVTNDVTWTINPETFSSPDITSVNVTATLYDITSDSFTVDGISVIENRNLSSLTISGTPTKTVYNEGDSFDPTGLVVTGKYDDSSESIITSDITWTCSPETLSVNTTSVNVTAKVGEITSSTYTVDGLTVNKLNSISIEERATALSWVNGTAYTSWSDSNNVFTFTCNGGGNNGKYYSTDYTYRMYSGGSLTITIDDSYLINDVIAESSPSISFTITEDQKSATASFSAATSITSFTILYVPDLSAKLALSSYSISASTASASQTIKASTTNITGDITYSWSVVGQSTDVVSLSNENTDEVTISFDNAGTTEIQCEVTYNGSDTLVKECEITVSVGIEKVCFSDGNTTSTIDTYDSYTTKDIPTVSVIPEDASQDVTYSIETGSGVISLNDAKTKINILSTGTATIKIASTVDSSKYAELTVNVSEDSIDNIRIKSGTSLSNKQFVGEPFDSTGLTFEKHYAGASKWNVCSSDDISIPTTPLTLNQSEITVTYLNTDIKLTIDGFTTYNWRSVTSSEGKEIGKTDDCLKIVSFIDTYMHMDYVTSEGRCSGEDGYYASAKEAFTSLSDKQRTLFMENDAFSSEKERLMEWARINGDQISKDEDSGVYSVTTLNSKSNFSNFISTGNNDNTMLNNDSLIVIILTLAIGLSLGGYMVYRKKKEA